MTELTGDSNAGPQQNGQQGSSSSSMSAGANVQVSAPTNQSDWRSGISEDVRNHAAISNFKDLDSFAKSYIHAQGLIGKKGIIPPGEKASQEELDSFYTALGRPPRDKYELNFAKEENINQEFVEGFKEIAFNNGILPKQAQAMAEWYLNKEKDTRSSMSVKKETETKEKLLGLKKEWGDGYDKEIGIAKMAVKELGPEFVKYMEESGLGNDVNLIKAFAKIGKLYGEDKLRDGGHISGGKTPAEIKDEIAKIMSDPKDPYHDALHMGHSNAVKKMEDLYRQLHK